MDKCASANRVGWQENKSALDCHRHMLEHRIATDVCFLVGSPEGAATAVHAHKYMLVSRSAVFEAMFGGAMTESRTEGDAIKIPDIDALSFSSMLKYIYYDAADVTAASALPLMYAAKKYLLTGLVRKCQEVLENNLNVNEVCAVLEQSLLLDELDLKKKCLTFIGDNFHNVMKTEGFQVLSRDALAEIISLDILSAPNEVEVFNACIDWAKRNLDNQSIHKPSDGQIREVLGHALFNIRFPTMEQTEFARCVGLSEILTPHEKNLVYYYIITKENTEKDLPFSIHPRELLSVTVNRFVSISPTPGWNCTGATDAIDFQSSVNTRLSGIGLYGGLVNSVHNIAVEILNGSNSLQRVERQIKSTGTPAPIKVTLDSKVPIEAGVTYTIMATIIGPQTFYGTGGRPTAGCGKGTITFVSSSRSANQTNHRQGQIPELYC